MKPFHWKVVSSGRKILITSVNELEIYFILCGFKSLPY